MIEIEDCKISNFSGAVLSIPKGSNIEIKFRRNHVENVGQLLEERNEIKTISLYEFLGIPNNTNPRDLAEILESLMHVPKDERRLIAERRGIVAKLGVSTASAIGFLSNLVTVLDSDRAGQIIAMLKNL